MAMFRKRIRASAPFSRNVRRKRFVRRRRRSGARRVTSMTQFQGRGGMLNYRARKYGKRRWRRLLWNSTQHKSHYRSYFTSNATLSTPATIGASTISTFFARANSVATAFFWLAANGATPLDAGGAVPLFTGSDIILRGGKLGLMIAAGDLVTDQVLVKVWLVSTVVDPDLTLISTPESLAWDPSVDPDFSTRIGKPILYRQAFLSTDMSDFDIQYRMKPQKIDQNVEAQLGKSYLWLVSATNLTTAAATTVRVLPYWNLSFSADSVGTT